MQYSSFKERLSVVKNTNEVFYDNAIIDTPCLTLRKFCKEDATAVLEYGSDDLTIKHLIWDGNKTLEEALTNITEYYWTSQGIYAIELKSENKCIGCIHLRLKPNHEKASFGYVLNRAYWGKGYMTEALDAILILAFEKLKLNRVEASHFVGNEGSGKVMLKCGMLYEGTGIQQEKVKGVFVDNVHYGITKERWESLQKNKAESLK